jgi:hypothetical protein
MITINKGHVGNVGQRPRGNETDLDAKAANFNIFRPSWVNHRRDEALVFLRSRIALH